MVAIASIRAGIATRHVYGYEKKYLLTIQPLSKQRSLSYLTNLATKIWKKHYGGKRNLPIIRFGPGNKDLGYPLSYTLGYSLIELAPNQRDILTLIHELVHAIGPRLHTMNFTKTYYNILVNYIPKELHAGIEDVLIQRHKKLLSPYL